MLTTNMMIDCLTYDDGMAGFWRDVSDTLGDQYPNETDPQILERTAKIMESHYVLGTMNTLQHGACTNHEIWERLAWHMYVEVDWLKVATKIIPIGVK